MTKIKEKSCLFRLLTTFHVKKRLHFITLASFVRYTLRKTMSIIDDLINQVDAFIKKYYINKMLKGVFLFALILGFSYILVVGLEYIGRFNTYVRAVLLFTFLLVNTFIFIKYILVPVFKLFSFGKRIDRYQAAEIIGKFFPDVNDKLLNTLQLNDALHAQQGNVELLKAGIKQNANKLSVFSFPKAVDYKENKRYLKYLLPLFLLLLLLSVFVPSFFRDGTERLVKYGQTFQKEAPFHFIYEQKELTVEEGSALTVQLNIKAKEEGFIPDKVFIVTPNGRFLMNKGNKNKFSFDFTKLKSSFNFHFSANGFTSSSYNVDVFERTAMGKFNAELKFPDYLDMSDQTVNNVGDIVVPEGTSVTWNGVAKNTKSILIGTDSLYRFNNQGFRYQNTFKQTAVLSLVLQNKRNDKKDSTFYKIEVVKDKYPHINVTQKADSISNKQITFKGSASDDHGITQVVFTYEITNKQDKFIKEDQSISGVVGTAMAINMFLDIDKLPLELDDELTYYFTAYDNDGVNGSKASTSRKFTYKVPSSSELKEKRKEDRDNSKEKLEQLVNESKDFNEQIDQLKMDLLNTANPSWKELQQLEKLQQQKKSLEERIKNLKEEMKNSFDEKNKLSPVNEDLLEKQQLLEDLLDDVMDDELNELLEKLEDLLKNQPDAQMQDVFEEMEDKSQDMQKQMDRTMEMLKRMDVEERMDDIESGLEELAKEQDQLKDQMENDELSNQDALEKEQELQDKFNDIQDQIEELMDKNEELKRPLDLDDLKEDQEQTNDEFNEAKENIEQDKNKKAKENQENISDQLEQMSSKMNAMKSQSQQDQQAEDMESLRRLLDNLLRLSFSQEENMNDLSQIDIYNPAYTGVGRGQRSIIDNMRPVEDSLIAIADRIPKTAAFINKELSEINKNFRNLVDDIDERRKRQWMTKQQHVMTSLNNLALFLNESLENMQQQMQGDGPGSGSCDNPGGKGKGTEGDEMQNIKDMLKKQLEEMEKGTNPGGKKPGEGGDEIKLPFGSKKAAKMAAQQSAMRKKIEQLREELNKDGKGQGGELNDLLKELEEQEEKLVNKKWDEEMIERQKSIMTRLLESEKAIEERGFDKERESNVGKDEENSNQIEFLEYNKEKEKQIELLRTLDPSFSKYYRNKANDYFQLIY